MSLKNKVDAFLCKYIGSVGQSLDKTAQAGHFVGGMVVPLVFVLFQFRHAAILGAILVDFVWGLTKEFYIDPMCEQASFADGWHDLWHYWVGSAVSLILIFVCLGEL